MLSEKIQKSLGYKDFLTSVWLELGKSADLSALNFTAQERANFNEYISKYQELGFTAKEAARAVMKDAYAGTISSATAPKAGTENMTNLRSPGAPEARITVTPGRSGRAVSRADDAFVGQNTSDRRHKPGYPQYYSGPSDGFPEDELTISGQDYQAKREISGSGEDKLDTRTRYREPGVSVRGEKNPDFAVSESPGRSGTYGRGAYLESIKNAKEQELAKSASRFLSPERLQAFRMGKPLPTAVPSPESRKSVLTKGILDKLPMTKARRDEQGGFSVGGATTFSEEAEESYEPSLTKLDDDEEKFEEANRLDEEAKILQERGLVEEAVDRRAKAVKIRSTISKSHYATTMKAHLQHGRDPI